MPSKKGIIHMNGKADMAKGRIKEATGVLINNDKLRTAGQKDQAKGKAKVVLEDAVKDIKSAARKSIDKIKASAK
jgi:uncharacterized protein YjbJ (UPF0337 family)